jgi:YbgC/YbaW family acyl-CoA thioester hydrolase
VSAFVTRRRVEFADTDAAGLCHFARFFVFFETAEHELLRSLGADAWMPRDGRVLGWPRVEATCRYLSPAFFGDELEVRLAVTRLGSRSVSYEGGVHRGETQIARGRWSVACCWIEDPRRLEPTPIPAEIAEGLARYAVGLSLTV